MGKAKAKKAQGDRKIESITIKDMVIDGERMHNPTLTGKPAVSVHAP
jgi:hypothetical protein